MSGDTHSAVEVVAQALTEWSAPNSWGVIGDELKEARRREAAVIIGALIRERYMEAE